MTNDKKALEAARFIKDYCLSHTSDTDDGDYCKECIFKNNDPNAVFWKGCILDDPDHLPETWQIDNL